MTKRDSFALIRSPADAGATTLHQMQRAAEGFARLSAWHPITHLHLDDGSYFFSSDGELHSSLASLPVGSRAWVPSLDHLGNSALALRRGIVALQGRAIELHVADLGGPIAPHVPGLMRGWQDAKPLEAELEAERAERKETEAQWARLFDEFQSTVTADLVKQFGIPAKGIRPVELPAEVVAAFPVPAPMTPARGKDFTVVGSLIKLRREQAGMTQQALADQLSVNASTLSRLERDGTGPQREAALAIVAPEALLPDELKDAGIDPGAFIVHRARALMLAEASYVPA